MTRNKWQTQRFGTMARNGLALALSLSMVLGMMPTGALQALAEEADVLETTPLEASLPDDAEAEEAAGSGATELQDESAENEGSEDAGAAEEETTAEELEPGVTEEPGAAEEPSADEAVAEGEGVAEVVDEAVPAAEVEAEEAQLEAEADGVRATLVVAAGVELPEGARLVVTPLDAAVEQAAAAAEEAEKAAAAEAEGGTEGVFASALSGLGDALAGKDSQVVTGADVALAGMTNAVDECVAKQEQESEAPATDEEQQTVVSAAYAIEVVDGEDHVVSVDDDQAKLTVTFDDGAAVKESEGVYAVKRDEAQPDDKPQVTEAMGAPVATVAEEEYKSEKAAAKAVVFSGEATDVTDDVQVDEESGAATIVLAGAPSVVVTKNAPKKAAVNSPAGRDNNRVSLKDDGFTLNLFNYFAVEGVNYNNGYYPDNHLYDTGNHIRYEGINSTNGTSATAHPFLFLNGGTGGSGYNYYTNGTATPMQGTVQNELDENYYPILAAPNENGTSLAYLFDETIPADQTYNNQTIHPKERYGNVDKLFERDEHGYYSYDSNKNYAYYDTSKGDGGDFYVHDDTYSKSGNSAYKIGFFPFDQWTSSSNDSSEPGKKDHHFGLTMSGTFTLPEATDGMVEYRNTRTGQIERNPVLFEMGGDDDMLVFIDGVLVLDLGGIHQPVHGNINFTEGTVNIIGDPLSEEGGRWPENNKAHVYKADDTVGAKTLDFSNPVYKDHVYDNGIDCGPHQVYTANIADAFALVNKTWNNAPGSAHRIDVFYLERGSYDSNLLVRFNMPLTPTTDLSVKKEWYAHGSKENIHEDSIMVQLYQQTKNEDGSYSKPRAYGDPVELKASEGYAYDFKGLPVHSDKDNDFYYYTVKEGVVINGQFVAAEDGHTVSDGYVYALDTITYEYANDSNRTEVYPTKEDAAFHNGNSNIKVGTATIANKREGQITVEKKWLNASGAADDADHSGDSVAVQLVKLTKTAQEDTFDNATEEVIDELTLDEANNWYGGFESNKIVINSNVKYVVYEGTLDGNDFVRSDVISTSGGAKYQLDSTRYYRTTISETGSTVQVDVDHTSAELVAQSTRQLYWWIDEYQNRYWLNRTYGAVATELAVNDGAEPQLTEDTVTQQLMIPYSASLIEDDSAYDYLVDVSFAESRGLNLTGVSIASGLAGSNATIVSSGGGYQLRVPAAWAKEHAGETFVLNIGVSASQTLQKVAGDSSRAQLKVVPTRYVVSGMAGHSAPVQDTWESEDGLQLTTGGTGHAILFNKPCVMADLTIKKTDAKTGDVLEGATFVAYQDSGDGTYDEVDDTRPHKRFPDGATEFVSGSDGTVNVTNLTPGTYWFVETSAPAGYLVMGPDNPIGVKVEEDGTVKLIDKNGADINTPKTTEPSLSTANNTNTLTVPNARLYELPAAGGLGAYPFLLAGSFIAALAFDRSGELRRKMLGLIRRSSKA